jgi:hypothetical protein
MTSNKLPGNVEKVKFNPEHFLIELVHHTFAICTTIYELTALTK